MRRLDTQNVVRYSTDAHDVVARATIEDVTSGQVITIEQGTSSGGLFELHTHPERQAIVFSWHPNIADATPRTLRVTILASARPVELGGPNATDAERLPEGLRINGSTQFVLATVVTDETGAPYQPTRQIIDTLRIIQQNRQGALGLFWMEPAREIITVSPLQRWSMRMSLGGADPLRDLAALPSVHASWADAAIERYLDTAARTLVIRGRAPRSGSYSVTVSARRTDAQTAEATFTVQSVAMQTMVVPEVLYPGIEYEIDPRLPDVANVEATLMDGSREIASVRSGKLRYTPRIADTGRTFTLVRTIDGERTEAPVTVAVRSFPAPEIRDVKDFGVADKKKVLVKFYGDKNKDRPTLDVVDGNAREPRKLYGNLHAADPNETGGYSWIEEFEVQRRDGSKPFTFTLQAKGSTGKKSALWKE